MAFKGPYRFPKSSCYVLKGQPEGGPCYKQGHRSMLPTWGRGDLGHLLWPFQLLS